MKRFTVLISLFILLLTACGVTSGQEPADLPALPPATPTLPAKILEAHKGWESSPHARTYGLEKGPNTYCSRCHSPQNWDPAASIDPPPNCVTCKFPTDAEIRTAKSNAFIPEKEWKSIGCSSCHPTQDGTVLAEISWLDVSTGYHQTVSSATELCEKCHLDSDTLDHKRDLGKQVHRGYQCTDCHDPHTTAATCSSAKCHHEAELASMPGLDPDHTQIPCTVCHDASGLAIDRQDGTWVRLRKTSFLGRETTENYISHNLQKSVDCKLCHFSGNPWNLTGVDQ